MSSLPTFQFPLPAAPRLEPSGMLQPPVMLQPPTMLQPPVMLQPPMLQPPSAMPTLEPPMQTAPPSILSIKLPEEVCRVLHVSNLPSNVDGDRLYELFGKFGAIRQLRIGNTEATKGQAFVIYEDVYDAKKAVDALLGQKVGKSRYLHIEYYDPKIKEKLNEKRRKAKEKEQEFKQQLKSSVTGQP